MTKSSNKRQVDFQVIARQVNPGDRILDLGCGRGVLLEFLIQNRSAYGVGVDIDFDKILSCVKRGVPAYQGDILKSLNAFPNGSFDRVVFSRTVEQLDNAAEILEEALRVGEYVTVGFVNHGFWKSRLRFLRSGKSSDGERAGKKWYECMASNPFSIQEFEDFCKDLDIQIENRVFLGEDWEAEVSLLPRLFAGYAIYTLSRL